MSLIERMNEDWAKSKAARWANSNVTAEDTIPRYGYLEVRDRDG